MIAEVLDALSRNKSDAEPAAEASVRDKVKRLTDRFPIYQN
jgi:glycine hydroxymethyltransferase